MRWLWKKNRERDLERELRSDLELEAEEQQERGLSAEEAQYAARRALGNTTQVKEEVRKAWGWAWLERVWQDVRYAIRGMLKNPGVTVIAMITLGLGTGANTAIFSAVNTVLLQPLPYKDADRLVMVWGRNRSRGFDKDQVSRLDFADWRTQNHVFEEIAASTDAMYTLTGSGEPTPIIGYQFSADYFHVLGVQPLLGRTFLHEEERPGKNRVVVLNYKLWQSHFGRDRNLVGKTVRLDGVPYTVIGIMPRGFEQPASTQLWTPLTIPPEATNDRAYRFLRVIGRLRPGVSLSQAQIEMNAIARRLAREYPKTNKDEDAVNLVSVRQEISGDIRPALLVLMCAVGFVLLIACANIANLLLVRAVGRQKEIAIRTALGAGKGRLIRQFLTESVVLAVASGAVGLLLAFLSTKALVAMFPPTIMNLDIPKVDEIPMDGWVLSFALCVSLLTGALFGLAPAIEAVGRETNEPLKESGRGLASSLPGRRFRAALVMAEVGLSLMLLMAAGLTMKTFALLVRGDVGFNAHNVLTLRVLLPSRTYGTEAKQLVFGSEVLNRIQSLPGVDSAGAVTFLPLSGWWGTRGVGIAGQSSGQEPISSVWSSVTPDYFRALRIPLVEGRLFTQRDASGAPAAAIVSRSLARKLTKNISPIGKRLKVDGVASLVEVIGVVGDVHQLGITSDLTSEIYLPFSQLPEPLLCLAIRTEHNLADLAKAAERQIWQVDKDQAVSFVMPMAELVSESLAPQRVVTILLGIFAGMALVMAAVGIYGVISFAAAQRTHEIGVRIALGAGSNDVLRVVVGRGLAPVAAGLVLGVIGSLGLMRFLSSLLYGLQPSDPSVFAIVSVVLAGSALLATYIPARRAMKVDPMVALRYE